MSRRYRVLMMQFFSWLREFDRKHRPLLVIPHGKSAAHMIFDNHLGHVQAKAGSLGLFFCGKVGMKYPADHFRRDPTSVITYVDDDLATRIIKIKR